MTKEPEATVAKVPKRVAVRLHCPAAGFGGGRADGNHRHVSISSLSIQFQPDSTLHRARNRPIKEVGRHQHHHLVPDSQHGWGLKHSTAIEAGWDRQAECLGCAAHTIVATHNDSVVTLHAYGAGPSDDSSRRVDGHACRCLIQRPGHDGTI